MSGSGASAMTARCMARSHGLVDVDAIDLVGSTPTTDQQTASRVMRAYSRSRSRAVTVFESQMRGM